MPLCLLTPTYALAAKDAATQHGAMRKSDACACNPPRRKATRRGPAKGPVALCTSPYISGPSPPFEDSMSSRQSFATVCARTLLHFVLFPRNSCGQAFLCAVSECERRFCLTSRVQRHNVIVQVGSKPGNRYALPPSVSRLPRVSFVAPCARRERLGPLSATLRIVRWPMVLELVNEIRGHHERTKESCNNPPLRARVHSSSRSLCSL